MAIQSVSLRAKEGGFTTYRLLCGVCLHAIPGGKWKLTLQYLVLLSLKVNLLWFIFHLQWSKSLHRDTYHGAPDA